jgi:hypothetical protein
LTLRPVELAGEHDGKGGNNWLKILVYIGDFDLGGGVGCLDSSCCQSERFE